MPERTFCTHPMSDDQLALVHGIAQHPFDQLRRDVYADWLEEHGEDEEALRQRQWTPAYQRICELIFDTLFDPDDHDDPAWLRKEKLLHEPQQQLDKIEQWALTLQKESKLFFPFDLPDSLFEEEGRAAFYRDVEIVSGVRISPEVRAVAGFRCAC